MRFARVTYLNAMYRFFIPSLEAKLRLLAADVSILVGTMVATILIRHYMFSSLEAGADVVTGFLVGFTAVVSFNSIVYFGSLAEPEPESES